VTIAVQPIAPWLDAVVESAQDLAANTLSMVDVVFGEPRQGLPSGVRGAYVALVGDEANVQFGLVASHEVCDRMARAMLMLDPEDELSADDMIDAVSELANILGGGVKRRMVARDPSLRLGLPLFVSGDISASQRSSVWSVAMSLSGTEAHLLVLQHDAADHR